MTTIDVLAEVLNDTPWLSKDEDAFYSFPNTLSGDKSEEDFLEEVLPTPKVSNGI